MRGGEIYKKGCYKCKKQVASSFPVEIFRRKKDGSKGKLIGKVCEKCASVPPKYRKGVIYTPSGNKSKLRKWFEGVNITDVVIEEGEEK